jgi:hypothetical protein
MSHLGKKSSEKNPKITNPITSNKDSKRYETTVCETNQVAIINSGSPRPKTKKNDPQANEKGTEMSSTFFDRTSSLLANLIVLTLIQKKNERMQT